MLTKKCSNCGIEFEKDFRISMFMWETATKFCSKKCFHEFKRVTIQCSICGNGFTAKRCHKDLLKTCSEKCRDELKSINSKKTAEKYGSPIHSEGALEKMTKTKREQAKLGIGLDGIKRFWIKGKWTIEKNPRWKPIGTKSEDGHGYILVKIADGKGFKNWKREHILVMEKAIGHEINTRTHCVHHIDENKENNNLENLMLMTHHEHKSLHMKLRTSK